MHCAGPSAFQTEVRLFLVKVMVILFSKALKPCYITSFMSLRMTKGLLGTGSMYKIKLIFAEIFFRDESLQLKVH